MFKVISKTNLIQNIPIIKMNGEESVACLAPRGSVFTRRITPSIQYLIDNRQVSVVETSEHLGTPSSKETNTSVGVDNGSFSESMNITEFNSEEEKDQIKPSELDTITEIVSTEESINTDKPKRGRRKKSTTGGDS